MPTSLQIFESHVALPTVQIPLPTAGVDFGAIGRRTSTRCTERPPVIRSAARQCYDSSYDCSTNYYDPSYGL